MGPGSKGLAYHCLHTPSTSFHEGPWSLHFLAPSLAPLAPGLSHPCFRPWVLGFRTITTLSEIFVYQCAPTPTSAFSRSSTWLPPTNLLSNQHSSNASSAILTQSHRLDRRRVQSVPEATVRVHCTTLTAFLRSGEVAITPDP